MKAFLILSSLWMCLGYVIYSLLPMHVTNRMIHPGYGACERCERTWDVVHGHITDYSRSGGCFPLCEECWTELETPEARLPYYRALVDSWKQWDTAQHRAEDKWAGIKEAVLAGK